MRVAGPQPPALDGLPVDRELRSTGARAEPVAYDERKRDTRARRLDAADVVVLVVENGEVEGQTGIRLNPVARLVGEQVFGLEVRAALDEERRPGRNEELAIDARRRAHRARNRRPERASLARVERQPGARLKLPAG